MRIKLFGRFEMSNKISRSKLFINRQVGKSKIKDFILVLAISCVLSACGTYNLANSVQAPLDKSGSQKETDTLACTHQADMAVNSAGRQVGDFILGATIIGAPVAYQMDKKSARNAFANCMNARGYNLVMPDGSKRQSVPHYSTTSLGDEVKPSVEIVTRAPGVALVLPDGWVRMPKEGLNSAGEILLYALNSTSDSGLILSVVPLVSVTNVEVFANSRAAAMASMLADPKRSDIERLKINGNDAFRFNVSGVTNGINIAYMLTVIRGNSEVAVLNIWTSNNNFSRQKSSMEKIAKIVTFSSSAETLSNGEHDAAPTEGFSANAVASQNPSYKSGFQPAYPSLGIKYRHQGTVILMILVSADGVPKDIKVNVTSGYHELDQAAIDAAFQWRFNPAVRDGVRVDGYARVPVNFHLNTATE